MAGGRLETQALPLAGSSTEFLQSQRNMGAAAPTSEKPRKKKFILLGVGIVLVLAIAAGVTVGVLISKDIIHVGSGTSAAANSGGGDGGGGSGDSGSGSGSGSGNGSPSGSTPTGKPKPIPTQKCSTKEDIPQAARGGLNDPTTWIDLVDFNCTFTDQTIGDLPLSGLYFNWDDSAQANPQVPALEKPWGDYTKRPARGVNLGGWLSLEPFITPSLFNYPKSDGVVDELTLVKKLGPKEAAAKLDKHYSTFITEDDFKAIADAGLDHIRIPFSYWAVAVYEDPFVFRVSWRYLLRGIEWARKYGLRVKLDLHALPGSQNGWNHSGRSGDIGFILGPNGAQNAQRALDIHNRLSKFFAQDRYKNVVVMYGLANEPAKAIPQDSVVQWTEKAFKIVSDNGVVARQVFSEGMHGLSAWAGKLQGHGDRLIVDAHQYTIFDFGLLGMKHSAKIAFACGGWADQSRASISSGFGPTIIGEWSQADTDCTEYLNGVGNGARWDGTFSDTGGSPKCPTLDSKCSCKMANADPSTFTDDYKLFLKTWAIAQMDAFEKSWGWFYWTWKAESAPLWSYQAGLEGGYMPAKAYERDWSCAKPVPSFGDLPEFY